MQTTTENTEKEITLRDKPRVIEELIVQGSLWAALWHLSWPQVLSNLLYSMSGFFDIYISGRIGKEAQAAIGMADQLMFLMVMLSIALQSGTVALISRFTGAQDHESAVEASRQSLLLAVVFGLFSLVLGLAVASPLMQALGAAPEVQRLGMAFLEIRLVSYVPGILMWIINSIFRARGEARLPMLFNLGATAIIIVGDFILCLNPFHLGVRGIAISWLMGGIFGASIGFYYLQKSDLGQCFDWSIRDSLQQTLENTLYWFKRIMAVGLPSCLSDLAWVICNFALLAILSHTAYGIASQASWAISLQFEELISMLPIFAIGIAVGTIVGQNLGAGNPQRAAAAGWQATYVALVYSCAIGAAMFFGAHWFASLMSTDERVIEYTVSYLHIGAFVQPMLAYWIVLNNAMSGAGYTRWPTAAIILTMFFVRIPLCWLLTLAFNMGPTGTWLGLNSTVVLISLLMIWRYRTGVWQLQKV